MGGIRDKVGRYRLPGGLDRELPRLDGLGPRADSRTSGLASPDVSLRGMRLTLGTGRLTGSGLFGSPAHLALTGALRVSPNVRLPNPAISFLHRLRAGIDSLAAGNTLSMMGAFGGGLIADKLLLAKVGIQNEEALMAIEESLRPRRSSALGFIGKDEHLLSLLRENHEILRRYGLTQKEVGTFLKAVFFENSPNASYPPAIDLSRIPEWAQSILHILVDGATGSDKMAEEDARFLYGDLYEGRGNITMKALKFQIETEELISGWLFNRFKGRDESAWKKRLAMASQKYLLQEEPDLDISRRAARFLNGVFRMVLLLKEPDRVIGKQEYLVYVDPWLGCQVCPFCNYNEDASGRKYDENEVRDSEDISGSDRNLAFINKRTGQVLIMPGLIWHLIGEHGFSEGKASPYYVDLNRLIEFFGGVAQIKRTGY